jgi:hypothetical protein
MDMNAVSGVSRGRRLPITGSLTLLYISSLVLLALLVAASVAALLAPNQVYPTQELREAALANDVVNLVVGVPILLGAMWLTYRGKLIGLLFWPGALLFVVYNALARTFDMPLGWVFTANLAMASLSVYSMIALVARIDGAAVRERLSGTVRARLSGGILVTFGAFVILRGLGVVGGALVGGTALHETELSVVIADVFLSPAWIVGGVLLWQRKALGYLSGAALLFQASMLFVGLIGFLLLQPALTDAPFDLPGVLIVSAMTLPCLVPFGMYMRGIVKSEA